MNKSHAKNILVSIAQGRCILISGHCKQRMQKRNVSTEDILHVLMWGKITNLEESDEQNDFKCTVVGKDLDEDELNVVADVSEKSGTIIITVF